MRMVTDQRETKRQKSNFSAHVMAALTLLFSLASADAQAAGQWWWQAFTPSYNGSLSLKDAAGTSVSTTQNPTAGNVKANQNVATQPPVVVIQTTAGAVYSQTFTSNGTFTVPGGVTKIYVTLAGASGNNYKNNITTTFAYGGKGGMRKNIPITVTPGATYGVYVGKKGQNYYGGNGCSGGGAAFPYSGGVNGSNGGQGFSDGGGLGAGAGPANGSFVGVIQWYWQGPIMTPAAIGNAGGYGGNASGQTTTTGGGGSSCFSNLVACAGGAASNTYNDGSNNYFYNGSNGACAGSAGDDTGIPDYDSDGFVSVQWMQ